LIGEDDAEPVDSMDVNFKIEIEEALEHNEGEFDITTVYRYRE